MIKVDIVDRVVEQLGVSRPTAVTSVETVLASLRDALGAGDRIELRGFGVFEVKKRKSGIGRNPKTRVEVPIPPGYAIRFKPGKELRDIRDANRDVMDGRQAALAREAGESGTTGNPAAGAES